MDRICAPSGVINLARPCAGQLAADDACVICGWWRCRCLTAAAAVLRWAAWR